MEGQVKFFNEIINFCSSKKEAISRMEDVLNLGKSALYRRMNGETALTLDEAILLSHEFKVSIDNIGPREDITLQFQFSAFNRPIKTPINYLDSLKQQLDGIRAMKNSRVYYASSEIPVFYYAFFPNLLKFKLYVWGRSIWDIDSLMEMPFSLDILPPSANQKIDEILASYTLINSTELWSLNILHNTINQIDFHHSSGMFKEPETALQLMDDLEKLVNHLYTMCKAKEKSRPETPGVGRSKFDLFHNEMIYTNNTILFLSDGAEILFSVLANPNFLMTADPLMIDYEKKWFKLLIRKSLPLSGPSEKYRSQFFNHLRNRIEVSKKMIESRLE